MVCNIDCQSVTIYGIRVTIEPTVCTTSCLFLQNYLAIDETLCKNIW